MIGKNMHTFHGQEKLSSDVIAFCALVTRILMRCLREKNPLILETLSLSEQSEKQEGETKHDITRSS